MKKLRLDIDGRLVEGTAAYDKGVLWVHMNGRTFTVEAEAKRTRRGARGSASSMQSPGDIMAPMPGKIIKINVAKGDTVTEGQVVLVMEAMKMEYTLKSPLASRISDVFCEPGQQVALGQILVKLEQS